MTIDTVPLGMLLLSQSFTLDAWILLELGHPASKLPVLCTLESEICLYLEDGTPRARYKDSVAAGTNVLPAEYWHHLTMRYDKEIDTLTLYVNGTATGNEAELTNVTHITWSTNSTMNSTRLYLGRDNTSYFQGTIDEVRVYRRSLLKAEIDSHLGYANAGWPKHQLYATAHYNMDENTDSGNLRDDSFLAIPGTIYGAPEFVHSWSDQGRFRLTYPTNR